MRPAAALALLAAAVLAGCAGPPLSGAPPVDGVPSFHPPVVALPCSEAPCLEPTVAARPDGVVAVSAFCGPTFALSHDGGATFAPAALPAPPDPPPVEWQPCDTFLQFDEAGRLFFSALLVHEGPLAGAARPLGTVQVARSDDGGATWPVNHHLTLLASPGGAIDADRQWVAVQGERVVVSYSQVGVGLHVALSTDGGATFGPFRRVVANEDRRDFTPGGPPVFGRDGALLLPYFASLGGLGATEDPMPEEVRVARSTDGGATWTHHLVHRPGGPVAAAFWPVVAAHPEGGFRAAWSAASGEVWVAASEDGTTWSEPTVVGRSQDPAWGAPWLDVRPEALDLFWMSRGDDGYGAHFARVPAGGTASTVEVARVGTAGSLTDFAHATRSDQGILLTWGDPDRGLLLAREGP